MANEIALSLGIGPQGDDTLDQIKYEQVDRSTTLAKATIKRVQIAMYGWLAFTYAAGAPVAKTGGIIKNLLSEFQVTDRDGNLVLIDGETLRYMASRISGKDSPALKQVNSEVLTSPSVGYFSMQATGVKTAVYESIDIPFECTVAQANFLDTLLHYNGKDDNTLKIKMNKITNMLAYGDATVGTWTYDLMIDIRCITTEHSGPAKRWKRYYKDVKVSGAGKHEIKLDEVENLMGAAIKITKGDAETKANFHEMQNIAILLEGKRVDSGAKETLIDCKLDKLIYADLNNKNIDSIKDGYLYLNQLNGNLLDSVRKNVYKDLKIVFIFPQADANFTYADEFTCRAHIDELDA